MSVTGSFDINIGDASFQPADVVNIGIARLPIQFKNLPIINGILQCVLPSFVPLEQSIARTIVQRNANVATGASLTLLGKLVGLARLTTIDDDFRRYVRAQIATNKSFGRFESIINIAELVLGPTFGGDVVLHNEGYATARLQITQQEITDVTATILNTLEQVAVAAGVRLVIEYAIVPPAQVFAFDSGPGYDVGHLATALD